MRSSKHTLQALLVSMVCGSCMSACITPYVLVTFLRDFNASAALISGLQVVLLAGMLSSLPGSVLLSNCDPRRCTIVCLLLARLPLLLIPLLLLMPSAYPSLPLITILLCGFLAFASSSAGGAVNTWFKNAIPAPILGRFLGNRNALNFLVMALVTPLVGYLLDNSLLSGVSRPALYTCIFTLAVTLGLLDVYYLTRAGGGLVPKQSPLRERIGELKTVFTTRRFWRIPFFSLLPVAGIAVLAPYLVLIFYDFGLSRFQNGIVTALATLGTGAGAMLGGGVADRNRQRLKGFFAYCGWGIAALHASILLLLLACGTKIVGTDTLFAGLIPLMASVSLLQGIALSLYTRLILDTVTDGSRIAFGFLAFLLNAMNLLISFSSSMLGLWLIGLTPRLQSLVWHGFHYAYALFALAALAGIVGGLAAHRLARRESGSHVRVSWFFSRRRSGVIA